jgi:RNA polymerase sigma-70 factor, ECF subfamily
MAQRSMTLPKTTQPLDQAATFEELFHNQWGRLVGALYRFTGDPAEAEDLAMEAFVRLWQRPPADERNLPGWLYRAATRLGLNRLRSAARRARYEQSAPPAENDASPEAETEGRAARARLRVALARLDERQARLLLLRHSGFSYQEIAAALGLNPASIGTLLARAERALVDEYK